ncbi:MAG: TonB-dependent receptor [Saprospiraceae bacterium]|nr:TonB-dependent receptor [Lewinella sp.]
MKILLSIHMLFLTAALCAQDAFKVSGTVQSLEGEAIAFATVTLRNPADSSLITGDYTDENGAFNLASERNNVVLVITYLGTDRHTQLLELNGNENLGVLQLEQDVMLDEVEVSARRRTVNYTNGTLTFLNTGQVPGQNSLELLKSVPLLMTDKDNNLLIKGSYAKVLINNRDLKLKGEELQNFLRTLTPDQIAKVEVITNPSAKYEASGVMGIVNIITKEKPRGFSASINTEGSYARYFSSRLGADLNYFSDKFGISLGVRRSDYKSFNDLDIIRTPLAGTGSIGTIAEESHYVTKGVFSRANLSMNYYLSPTHTFSAFLKAYRDTPNNQITGSTRFSEDGNNKFTDFMSNSNLTEDNVTMGANYEIKLDSSGQLFALDYIHLKVNKDNMADQLTSFYTNGEFSDDFALSNPDLQNYTLHSLKGDYTLPINTSATLEAGLEYTQLLNKNLLSYDYPSEDSAFIYIPIRNNDYTYREKTYSAYVSGSFSWEPFSLRVGTRMEYTDFSTLAKDSDSQQRNTDHYLNLFPNLALTFTSEKGNTLSFSYSRRLNRPYYRDLNPSILYATQYLYMQGNSFLRPEYSNNLELGAKLGQYIFAVFANFKKQTVSDYIAQDETYNTTLLSKRNLDSSDDLGFMLNTSYDLGKKASIRLSALGQWQRNSLKIESEDLSRTLATLRLNGVLNYKLSAKMNASWSSRYNSPFLYGLYRVEGQFINSLNVVYQMEKLNIGIGVQDIFKAGQWDSELISDAYRTRWINRWPTGVISLSLSYQFGNQEAASKGSYSGSDDRREINRIN